VAFNIYAALRLASETGGGSTFPAFAASLAGMLATGAFWSEFSQVIKSLLFIPYINHLGNPHPLLSVGWTLNMEMHFYLCFALMLNFKKTLAPGLTLLMVAGVIALARWMPESSPFFTLHASGYPIYFCGGIFVYYLWKGMESSGLHQWKWIAVPAALSGVALYLAANLFPQRAGAWIQAGPVILVLSALVLHTCEWRVRSRAIMLLGASSYALYLTHTLVLELLRVFARKASFLKFEVSTTGLFLSLLACVSAAVIVHLLIELPMTGWLRRRWAFAPRPLGVAGG